MKLEIEEEADDFQPGRRLDDDDDNEDGNDGIDYSELV
jgi:hypothetical protein